MTVRVYRWNDASAPVLTGNAADYKLIDVLDKCLVAGYGAHAAAGWTKEFTGTGKAVFKQGAGSNGMRLRVDCSTSSMTPRVRGFEEMTDVDTGIGPFPTDAQISGGGYFYVSNTADTTARPWVIVASEKAFYLYVGHDNTTAQGISGSTTYKQIFFFGDIVSYKAGDSFHTLLISNSTASNGGSSFAQSSTIVTPASGHFMARDHTQIGAAVTVGKSIDRDLASGVTIFGTGGSTYPDPVTGGMRLDLVRVFIPSSIVLRGVMPGLWVPMHNMPGQPGDTFSGSGTLAEKTFLLLDAANSTARARVAIETSDTW